MLTSEIGETKLVILVNIKETRLWYMCMINMKIEKKKNMKSQGSTDKLFLNTFCVKVSNSSSRNPPTSSETPYDRHLERNQNVPGQPSLWGPPWNLLVFHQVSLTGSYKGLKVGFQYSSYFFRTYPAAMFNNHSYTTK
jgi:hypothetical protein